MVEEILVTFPEDIDKNYYANLRMNKKDTRMLADIFIRLAHNRPLLGEDEGVKITSTDIEAWKRIWLRVLESDKWTRL